MNVTSFRAALCGLVFLTFLPTTPVNAGAPVHGSPAAGDIVDTAVDAGSFKTLATALTAAGYVSRRRKTTVSV